MKDLTPSTCDVLPLDVGLRWDRDRLSQAGGADEFPILLSHLGAPVSSEDRQSMRPVLLQGNVPLSRSLIWMGAIQQRGSKLKRFECGKMPDSSVLAGVQKLRERNSLRQKRRLQEEEEEEEEQTVRKRESEADR
ncbi:unnamed protein product [Pleuronectes platessa]|uniref:Uncharacterized protein n=1 Tax=Pleuronectes platessa TaxID=8262 RepID=A0A9N7TI07_PLEPL|nr:unnamed protein product [Pleuronectes platessa]